MTNDDCPMGHSLGTVPRDSTISGSVGTAGTLGTTGTLGTEPTPTVSIEGRSYYSTEEDRQSLACVWCAGRLFTNLRAAAGLAFVKDSISSLGRLAPANRTSAHAMADIA